MSNTPIHVLIVGGDADFLREARDALGLDKTIAPALAGGGLQTLRGVSAATLPKLVIARYEATTGHGFEELSAFTHRFPGVPILLVFEKKDPDLMMNALHAGVREFLFEPLVPTDVLVAAKRLIGAGVATVRQDAARVEVFIPCKGGSGATFLAANLAHVLAETMGKRVLLLDFNLQFGDAYLFLMDQMPPVSLVDVCGGIDRLDAAFLESAATRLDSGLQVLAAPPSPEEGEVVRPEHIETVIGLARSFYDFVIVDASRSFDAVTLKALDLADHVYAVLQLDLPYIRHAKRMKELFAGLGYSSDKVRWVVNRYVGKEDVALADAERLLTDAFWTVPNDHRAVVASVNQGIPLTSLKPGSPVAKSLRDWAARLAPAAPEPARRGWFGFLRGSRKEADE
jgi:pilus assembly protein CpaE